MRDVRSIVSWVSLLSGTALASCAWTPRAYENSNVNRAHAATMIGQIGRHGDRLAVHTGHAIEIDVYDYEHGCPNFNRRSTTSGYRGTVALGPQPVKVLLPTGRHLAFRIGWFDQTSTEIASCVSAITFRPKDDATYLVEYVEQDEQNCKAWAAEMKQDPSPGGPVTMIPIKSLILVPTKLTFWGYSSEGLCDVEP